MNLQTYHDLRQTKGGRIYSENRSAVVVSEGRRWMTLLVVKNGHLALIRRARTEKQYMTPQPGNERKVKATLRRLARKAGTTRQIRAALAVGLEVTP